METKLIKKIGAYSIVYEDEQYCVYGKEGVVYIEDTLEEAEEAIKVLMEYSEKKENEKE